MPFWEKTGQAGEWPTIALMVSILPWIQNNRRKRLRAIGASVSGLLELSEFETAAFNPLRAR